MPRGVCAEALECASSARQGSAEVGCSVFWIRYHNNGEASCLCGHRLGSESHHVFLMDKNGRMIGEKIFKHGG